jgi:hypothetical protein
MGLWFYYVVIRIWSQTNSSYTSSLITPYPPKSSVISGSDSKCVLIFLFVPNAHLLWCSYELCFMKSFLIYPTWRHSFDFSLKVVRLLYQGLFAVQSKGCEEFFEDFGQFFVDVKEVLINSFKKLDLLIRFRGVCQTKRVFDRFDINLFLKLGLIISCNCVL